MKAIVAHFAFNSEGGEYIRVKKNISLLEGRGVEVIEVIFCKVNNIFKLSNNFSCKRRVVLPILIPGVSNRVINEVNNKILIIASFILNVTIKPLIVWGETHQSAVLCSYFRKRVVNTFMDVHGALPEEVSLVTKNLKLFKRYNLSERNIFSSDFKFIFQSEAMRRHIEEKHKLTIANSVSYCCGYDESLFFYDKELRRKTREELNIDGSTILFIYSGGLHKWQKVEESLNVFAEISKKKLLVYPMKFMILTNTNLDKIIETVKKLELVSDVIFRSVSHEEVNRYLNAADVAFLLRDDIVVNRVASPTKLAEYLACRLPVITERVYQSWIRAEDVENIISLSDYTIEELSVKISLLSSLRDAELRNRKHTQAVYKLSMSYQGILIKEFLDRYIV